MSNSILTINGGKPIIGEVTISGSKNSAVAVIAAALLSEGICVIENVPSIEDVVVLGEMIEKLGANISIKGDTVTVDSSGLNTHKTPADLVRRMRASSYLMGVLLARMGKAQVAIPGGCEIGSRSMDQHEKGLKAMGAHIELVRGEYVCSVEDRLHGSEIYLDMASVGATINLMIAAARAKGTTVIVNAAREPHVVDTANFLNAMGARVKGAGTDTIRITGVDSMHGCRYSILPDMIEAGTWMCIALATKGDITVRGCVPYHMESVSAKLVEMGANLEEGEDYIRVKAASGRLKPVNIRTYYYPGFPTDLQQPFAVLCSVADGTSVITENIFESRYKYIDEIKRMGARVRVADRIAVIDGVDTLWGTEVRATDLRAGAALVVAGLMADGTTVITDALHIDRGYERLHEKLHALGADIERTEV